MVRVQARDGVLHEGVLHTAAARDGSLAVVLKQARVVSADAPWAAPYTGK